MGNLLLKARQHIFIVFSVVVMCLNLSWSEAFELFKHDCHRHIQEKVRAYYNTWDKE